MPIVTVTDHCPRWCARDHSADTCGTALYHASETTSVTVSRPGDLAAPDRLEVQAAQYLPDDPGEPSSPPTVEIAVHGGGRYRLIGLTPAEARELAAMLMRAADAFGLGLRYGQLETEAGYTLMAADTPPGMEFQGMHGFGVSLSGDDADVLRRNWDKLSDGGTVTMPLQKQAWGDEFGMCTDKFGVPWLVNIGQPQA